MSPNEDVREQAAWALGNVAGELYDVYEFREGEGIGEVREKKCQVEESDVNYACPLHTIFLSHSFLIPLPPSPTTTTTPHAHTHIFFPISPLS